MSSFDGTLGQPYTRLHESSGALNNVIQGLSSFVIVKMRSSHPRGVDRGVRSQLTWASQIDAYSLVARGTRPAHGARVYRGCLYGSAVHLAIVFRHSIII